MCFENLTGDQFPTMAEVTPQLGQFKLLVQSSAASDAFRLNGLHHYCYLLIFQY